MQNNAMEAVIAEDTFIRRNDVSIFYGNTQ